MMLELSLRFFVRIHLMTKKQKHLTLEDRIDIQLQLAKYRVFWSKLFSKIITKANQSAQKTLSWFSQWLSFYSTQFYFWFSSRNKSKTWPCWTIPTSFSYGAFRSGRRKIRNFSDKYGLFSPRIKNLYASRWGIETSFRDLKYSIGLVNFHAKKKEGILQEIFARFTNFNFCRWVTSQVAIDNSHKKRYKVCFSDAAYACRLFFNVSLSSL